MKLDRRTFISGSTALISAAAFSAKVAAGDAVEATHGAPFKETRGGRSSKEAKATRALADHGVNLKYSDLDETTKRKVKQRILDLVGCAIGGSKASGNAALVKALQKNGGAEEATVIGYPDVKIPASRAAMANAIIARSYDYEVMMVKVGNREVGSHNSPTINMTALALAESTGVSGKEYMTALVAGDDIGSRILASAGFSYAAGWDGSGVFSSIPASVVASRLLGSTVEQTVNAMGVAVNSISGTVQNDWDGVTTWKYAQGLAAQNAVFAAELANGDWTSIGDALFAPYGFFAQYSKGCDRPDILTTDLGKVFYGEEYYKPYPSCAATHPSHECALALIKSNGVSAEDIEHIEVRLPERSLTSALTQVFDPQSPDPHCAAIFSIRYQVGNAFLRGMTRQEHYSDEAMNDPKLHALLAKLAISGLPEGQHGVQIEVTTKSGKKWVETHSGVSWKKPTRDPSTYEEIVTKFRGQAKFSGRISEQLADEIIQRVENLEKEENIADFVKLIA